MSTRLSDHRTKRRPSEPVRRAPARMTRLERLERARLAQEHELLRREAQARRAELKQRRRDADAVPAPGNRVAEARDFRLVPPAESAPASTLSPKNKPVMSRAQKRTTRADVAAHPAPPPCHWGLIVLALLLVTLSVPLIYSASTAIALQNHGRPDFFGIRQIGYALVGTLVLFLVSRLSAKGLRMAVWALYLVALIGLLLTDFSPFGIMMGGVKRWMKIGPIQLQMSELAKIALIGVLADFWSYAGRRSPDSYKPWVVTAALTLPVVGFVFMQPHLSAAVLLFILPFFVAFYAGVSWKPLLKIVLPVLLGAMVVIMLCRTHSMPLLKTYQQDRIASHFGMSGADEQGGNYQVLQGQRALARGGIFGTGPGGSIYKQGHLPAPHTDFIFAVIGEEWGLVGMLGLVTLYTMMIFFCFQTGHCARQPFEAVLCAGIGTLLLIQTLGNLAVLTGRVPVTGMPLPILTYGGSGLICTMLGLGLVLSVSRRYGGAEDNKDES